MQNVPGYVYHPFGSLLLINISLLRRNTEFIFIFQQISGVLPAAPLDDDQFLPDSLPLVRLLLVSDRNTK